MDAEVFEGERRRLFGLAYRMLASAADAAVTDGERVHAPQLVRNPDKLRAVTSGAAAASSR